MLMRSYVVIEHYVLADETANFIVYFNNDVIVTDVLQKSRVIYRYKCCRVDTEEEYIGESGRTFAKRLREDMRAPSPIHDHHNITGHEQFWKILVQWAGRTKVLPGTSKRQY